MCVRLWGYSLLGCVLPIAMLLGALWYCAAAMAKQLRRGGFNAMP